jgi:hypothetical protein
MGKKQMAVYEDIARLAHGMVCRSRNCNYPDDPDMGYLAEHVRVCMGENKMDQCRCSEKITMIHCQAAVDAENLAAAIFRAIRVVK